MKDLASSGPASDKDMRDDFQQNKETAPEKSGPECLNALSGENVGRETRRKNQCDQDT